MNTLLPGFPSVFSLFCLHLLALFGFFPSSAFAGQVIDRHALVSRHNPVFHAAHPEAPLTLGNGGFAFTFDVTGLQTFGEDYTKKSMPLETLARWAWGSEANPKGFNLSDANKVYQQADGTQMAYPTEASSEAGQWLRRNPHDQPLGVISLVWKKPDGSVFTLGDVQSPEQQLELWSGIATSRFKLGGKPVSVSTSCAPNSDSLGIEIVSPLLNNAELYVRIAFPRGHDPRVKNTPPLDWSEPASHHSVLLNEQTILRKVAGLEYHLVSDASFERGASPHEYFIKAHEGERLAFTLTFSAANSVPKPVLNVARVREASRAHWESFWKSAAALDLSGSSDPRAAILEGRVILSQYLTAIQLAGDVPPQESGLLCSTWYGKHHTEMIWWHVAHFAFWGQTALVERNLNWYRKHLPEARELATSRGLQGARWAKMVGPDDRESPGGNPLIIWNQPHLIYLCELLYRAHPSRELLEQWSELVGDTAECMASMATRDAATGRYVLGPPLWIAQEIHDPQTSQNPAFELAYWGWGLRVAQQWRARLGLPAKPHWDEVIAHLSPMPQVGGRYVALESHPDTWSTVASRHDHPEMLMALGFLPMNPAVDPACMGRTLDAVLAEWDWNTKIWGWDYPMIAMTATRLMRPKDAVDCLLRDAPNNHYLPNGSCPQSSDVALAAPLQANALKPRPEIATYLPANGSFLAAVSLMVAGWDGCQIKHPGFPKDGSWQIQAEGWQALP